MLVIVGPEWAGIANIRGKMSTQNKSHSLHLYNNRSKKQWLDGSQERDLRGN